MNISRRRLLAVLLVSLIVLALGSLGTAGAQQEAPAPTPAPGIEQPAPDSATAQPPAPNEADDNRTLVNGKPLIGTISPSGDQDVYLFFGVAGQTVTLSMTKQGTTALDGYMELYFPYYDEWLAYDDDSGGNGNPLISQYTLPYSGKYRLLLTSWSAASTGKYTVRLTVNGVDVDDNRLLVSGKTLSGKIAPNGDVDHYFFWGLPGQKATINMLKGAGALDPLVELYEPDGDLLASDDDSGAGTNALINNVPLLVEGYYRVVTRGYANASSGAYKVRVNLTQANLALNKPSTAWNWHAPWYLPEYGNDGDQNSRWAGDDGTNWWWVDLGSPKTFSQVKINWEAAYATNYFVGWSDAPNCLGVYTGYLYRASSAGWKTHNLGKHTARCVAVRMDVPVYWATNYSFWEFEVYNLAGAGSPAAADPESTVVAVEPPPDFGEENLVQFELTAPSGQP